LSVKVFGRGWKNKVYVVQEREDRSYGRGLCIHLQGNGVNRGRGFTEFQKKVVKMIGLN